MNKNNSLIEKPKSIFSKVINFFKSFFWKSKDNVNESIEDNCIKNKKKVKEEIILDTDEEILERIETYDYYENESFVDEEMLEINDMVIVNDSKEEKTRFFEIYRKIKSHKISIQDIDGSDLFRISLLLKEEEKLKKTKIIEQKEILYKKNAV